MSPHAGLGLSDPARESALLLGIIEATATGPLVEPLAAAVARLILDATANPTDVCFVHVLDDTDRSLTLVGATPPFDDQVGRVHLPLGTGVAGWVASHGEPVVIAEHKHEDPRYVPIAGLRGQDFTSMASVPMIAEPAGLAGVLNVHTVERREFGERDVRLLLAIGRLVAGAVHQARMHRRLAVRERIHERFAEHVVAAQEAERRRLARDIHDGISQRLVTLSFHLDAASSAWRAHEADESVEALGTATEQLDRVRELVDMTLEEARAAIGDLHPPALADLGLAAGLAGLARDLPGVEITLNLADDRLPEHVEVALYRIVQESLQNVVKHAGASHVRVAFSVRDGRAQIEVADDGVGFTVPDAEEATEEGYGYWSMRERAELVGGTLRVASRPGAGTTVTATVPASSEAETWTISEESPSDS